MRERERECERGREVDIVYYEELVTEPESNNSFDEWLCTHRSSKLFTSVIYSCS